MQYVQYNNMCKNTPSDRQPIFHHPVAKTTEEPFLNVQRDLSKLYYCHSTATITLKEGNMNSSSSPGWDKYRALLSSASKTAGSDNVSCAKKMNRRRCFQTFGCSQYSFPPFFSGKLPPDVLKDRIASFSGTLGGVSNCSSKALPSPLFALSVQKHQALSPTGISQSLVNMQSAG